MSPSTIPPPERCVAPRVVIPDWPPGHALAVHEAGAWVLVALVTIAAALSVLVWVLAYAAGVDAGLAQCGVGP